ncbi:MAG: AAA family ATPase [Bacteroidales bacterium]|jgi:dephospho-CoA kinase|nr:hypothetical protein [Lentimicrobiaceae bacterium]MDG1136178.1 AAA family ATPase [Bacteroidales bacterium]MDG1902707.1 AAA family ATPase [Bacteroidales bacterium]MDG2081596.1 AAA family ATPase [Bacteroidales bacterium]|tara:strand:+ start:3780 stop:4328 length:549 start_codon:yes stop_codon:yes gene_type:complete
MKVIGITGTLGAGKGTIVEYLVNNLGYNHFSVREYLTEEIKKRGMPVNRDSMTNVANELRSNHSPSYIIEQLYERAVMSGSNSIIESIRTPGEIDYLENQGNFLLIAVDADPKIRYDRILIRGSSTDNISYDTFISNEKRELTSTDPNKQNLSACAKRADIKLYNNLTIDDLIKKLTRSLSN